VADRDPWRYLSLYGLDHARYFRERAMIAGIVIILGLIAGGVICILCEIAIFGDDKSHN
jgi:hypothetical protein